MTQEEKAKAYDAAREKIAVRFGTNVAEEIFSEFEESEDEKIRKGLIKLVKATQSDELWCEYCVPKVDALAWLEKQKIKKNEWFFEKGKWYVKLQHHYEGDLRHFERGHVYQALSEVKITDGYHNVSLSSWEIPKYFRPATKDEIPKQIEKQLLNEDNNIRNYFINAVKEQPNIHQDWKEKCLAWLEKQGEKKTIIIPKFRVGDEIKTSNEESLTITKIDEKGYWSEDLFICGFDDAAMWELVEQKPAWSEEDERMCQETIDWFEKKCFPYALESENPARESIKWLKSLKQKIGWKPSDEQMQCLHDAIEHYHTNGYPASKLTELYEQMLYIYKL